MSLFAMLPRATRAAALLIPTDPPLRRSYGS